MARSRNIKPGFFTNEVLGELPPLARILFAGMWCHADREGRLEDRMRRMKPQVLPYDECDIDALAQCLHDAKLVHRYVVGGKGYIQVIEFKKHQNPHVKEQLSTIPAPDMHGASTGVAGLIPDSLNLIPDSLKPQTSKPLAPRDKSRNAETASTSDSVIAIPLIGDAEYHVSKEFAAELEALYPAVDMPQTLREIRAWNIANPKNRKTASGIKRHINQWFAKDQNRG
jgi:hypothetical protein